MTAADEWASEYRNPMFDRMTDGEIAAYFEDRNREPSGEPPEDYLEAEAERHARYHREKDHDGGKCDCPPGEPDYGPAPF